MYFQECRLLGKCLNQNPGLKASVSNGWPSDESVFKKIDALVFYSSPAAYIIFSDKKKPSVSPVQTGLLLYSNPLVHGS